MRHSRPAAVCGVSERDPAAGLTADEQGVARDVLALDVLEELVGPGRGQPVDEGPGGVEEREHGVEVAVGPLARRAAGRAPVAATPSATPAPCQIAQSTDSAVTPGAHRPSSPTRAAAAPARERRRDALGGAADRPEQPGPRWLDCSSSASSTSLDRPPPEASSSCRSSRRSRRRPTVSEPPTGESTRSAARTGSMTCSRRGLGAGDSEALLEQRAAAAALRSRRAPASRPLPAPTGTPAWPEQSPHRVGAARPAHDDRHVGPGHALDEVGPAQQ